MSMVEWDDVPEVADSNDEEREQRNDIDLERAVLDFIDEPSIRHDLFPKSSDSEDEDDIERLRRIRERERNRMHRGDGRLFEGQVFFNGVAFKEAVLDYALSTTRNIKQYRYDKTKLGYSCVGDGCDWRVYCSTSGRSCKWQIKILKDVHTCVSNGECEMIKVPVIARLFLDKIWDEPDYFMPMKIEQIMKERWKITITRPQCQAARNKAVRLIEREYNDQFGWLRDYANEIQMSNVDSVVEIDTFRNEKGLDVFNSFYVCFDCLRSWKTTCRPLIGVDGCFLKSKMKGQLLVALRRDADNAIYPIAWAVVQVENTDMITQFSLKT